MINIAYTRNFQIGIYDEFVQVNAKSAGYGNVYVMI